MGKHKSNNKIKKSFGTAKKTAIVKEKKENPFDLIFKKRQDKSKFGGSKLNNGQSRKSFMQARMNTIGTEYNNRNKVSQLIDRRLAQRNLALSAADKAEQRFILQQKRLFTMRAKNKLSKFNLNQDDVGKEEIDVEDLLSRKNNAETFKEEEDELDGELDPELVSIANFGGGSFNQELDDTMEHFGIKSATNKRAEIMKNMIAISKKAKAVRQMQKDEQIEKTDKLNDLFTNLQKMGSLVPGKGPIKGASTDFSSYDEMYLQLKLDEPKASVSREFDGDEKQANNEPYEGYNFSELLEEYYKSSKFPSTECLRKLKKLVTIIHKRIKKDVVGGIKQLRESIDSYRNKLKEKVEPSIEFYEFAIVELVDNLLAFKFHHPVCAPLLFYSMEAIAATRIRNPKDCVRALIFCKRVTDWVLSDSGNCCYLPELVAFLQGALQLAAESIADTDERFPTMSFPISQPHRQMLWIEEEASRESGWDRLTISLSEVFSNESTEATLGESSENHGGGKTSPHLHDESVLFKVHAIRLATLCVNEYSTRCANRYPAAFCAIFSPIYALIKRLPLKHYPLWLQKEVNETGDNLNDLLQRNSKVTQMKRIVQAKLKPIKMLEPRFDESYNPESHRSRDKAGRTRKMAQKLRKETRGAIKELRKDAKFLSRMQSDKLKKVNQERIDKTKRIMQSLQVQESEYKKRKLKKF